MPSENVLLQKQQVVAELTEKLKSAVGGVLVDYKGISVENDTKLRKELREAGVEYSVVKNRLLAIAAKNAGLEELIPSLENTTALAVSKNDQVAAARILNKYAENSKGAFSVKCGFSDGKVVDAGTVAELAKLPSKETLIAMVLCGFKANIRGLVIALNAIAEKENAQ